MSTPSYEERFRRFTEACDQLRPLHQHHLQEQTLKDEQVALETKLQDVRRKRQTLAHQMAAAQEANEDLARLHEAVGEAMTAEKNAVREHKEWLERRDEKLKINRRMLAQEEQFLKDCARRLVELNPLFANMVKEEWSAMEDSVEEQACISIIILTDAMANSIRPSQSLDTTIAMQATVAVTRVTTEKMASLATTAISAQ